MITDWLLHQLKESMIDGDATVGSEPTHMAVGTGSDSESGQDTELQTETFRKAIETVDTEGETSTTYYLTLDTTESNETLREFGVFDESSGGNMHLRQKLPTSVTKEDSEELRIVVTIQFDSV